MNLKPVFINQDEVYSFAYNPHSFKQDSSIELKKYRDSIKGTFKKSFPNENFSNLYFSNFFLLLNNNVYILGTSFATIESDNFRNKRVYSFIGYTKRDGFIKYSDCYDDLYSPKIAYPDIVYPECFICNVDRFPVIKNKIYVSDDFESFVLIPSNHFMACTNIPSFYYDGALKKENINEILDCAPFCLIDCSFKSVLKTNLPSLGKFYVKKIIYLLKNTKLKNNREILTLFKQHETFFNFLIDCPETTNKFEGELVLKISPCEEFFVYSYILKNNEIKKIEFFNDEILIKTTSNNFWFLYYLLSNPSKETCFVVSNNFPNYLINIASTNKIKLNDYINKIIPNDFCFSHVKTIFYLANMGLIEKLDKNLELVKNSYFKEDCHIHWYNEFVLYLYLKMAFPDAIFQYNHPLLNNQVFDIFLPSKNCAIEYQGEIHYKKIDYFEVNNSLEERQKNDQLKRDICKKNGIKLIEWNFEEKVTLVNVLKRIYREFGTQLKFTNLNFDFIKFINLCFSDQFKSYTHKKKQTQIYVFCKYDIDGNFIEQYDSINIASLTNKISPKTLYKACSANEGFKVINNFQWRKFPFDNIPAKIKAFIFRDLEISSLKIGCFDDNGGLVKLFNNVKEASLLTKIDRSCIVDAAIGVQRKAGNFIWKFIFKGEKND